MALIDFDKFLASFITEMKECSQMRNFSIPRCIKKALDDQGLEYKDGEIIKSQRRVSAEAKEAGYCVSEDERIMEKIIATIYLYYGEPLEDEAKEMIAWLEKQGSESNWCHHKMDEETINKDLEYAALLHYPKMSRISEPHGFIPADNKSHYLGDANEDNRKAFIVGAQWQKEQDQSTIELAEDHAMLAGMEKMKQEIIDKAMVWLTSNMKWGVVSWDDKEECVRTFKKAMEE